MAKREKYSKNKKKIEKFSFKKEYKICWNFLKESKKFFLWTLIIFLFSALLGYFISAPESLAQQIIQFLEEIFSKTANMSHVELNFFILLNNLQASLFGLLLGIFFGIFPIIATLVNGYVIGFVASKSVSESGLLSLLSILPHGIFEIPALIISLGLGIKLGSFILKKDFQKTAKSYLVNSLKVFILIVIPLLILASIIESALIVFLS